jgi:hypothetical protein
MVECHCLLSCPGIGHSWDRAKPQPLFSEQLGTILFSKQNYSSVSEQLLSVLVNNTLQFSEQNRDDALDSWSITRRNGCGRLEAPKP